MPPHTPQWGSSIGSKFLRAPKTPRSTISSASRWCLQCLVGWRRLPDHNGAWAKVGNFGGTFRVGLFVSRRRFSALNQLERGTLEIS